MPETCSSMQAESQLTLLLEACYYSSRAGSSKTPPVNRRNDLILHPRPPTTYRKNGKVVDQEA